MAIMGLPAKRGGTTPIAKKQRLQRGSQVLLDASTALRTIAESLDEDFLVAVDRILAMQGCLIVCGIGKAGLVGRKISATFASTGTRSHFLHPSEAIHGDLGSIGPNDVMLILSNSGATEEIVRLLPYASRRSAGMIAITSAGNSPLARAADIALILPPLKEACRHNLAPSTSTTAMLALGDALALVVSEARGFEVDDFAELHPGGSLGRKLSSVDEAMRPLSECRVARSLQSVREMLSVVARPGRRTGAVMLVDDAGVLEGIFTDSDLAKMLEHRRDQELDQPIRNVMTKSFSAIQSGARLSDAIDVMVMRKISELPVVDHRDQPIGLIDITDVLQIEHECQTPSNTALRNASNDSTHSFGMKLKNSSLGNGPTMDDEWSEAPRTLRFFGPKS